MTSRGFTLIELTIVLSLAGILLVSGIVAFNSFRAENNLSSAADFVKTTLEKARDATLAQEDNLGYSLKVNDTNLVWFKGQNFNPSDPANQILNLPSGIKVQNISLENASNIVTFNILTGTTSPGNIILAVSSEPAKISTLYLSRSGLISSANSVSAAKSLTDSRHLHFNLGWSVQNASQLRFRFLVSPEDTRIIDMAPYFNADKTNWDYSGSFAVEGQSQKIRIHTHSLSASNALLSISRSLMENNQPVEISIDSKIIVTYAADGSATKGPFGGEMTAP